MKQSFGEKLFDLVRHSSKAYMSDEEDVLCYCRQFFIFSMPILNAQRLSNGQRNELFWRGFHRRDRAEMYTRLSQASDQPSCVNIRKDPEC